MSKHIILFLSANPLETARIAVDREARTIQEEIERNRLGDAFELVTRLAARPSDLIDGLSKLRPSVVHFSGHGVRRSALAGRSAKSETEKSGAYGLLFEGPDGRSQFVSADAIRRMFQLAATPVTLMVLSAAYSDMVAEALLAHVKCAVAFAGEMHDEMACTFMTAFYRALAARQTIASCHRMGGAAFSAAGFPAENRPRLMVGPGVDVEQLVLVEHPIQPNKGMQPRDIRTDKRQTSCESRGERRIISVIGIDRYRNSQCWQPLSYAVSDARGAAAVFEHLGFEQATPPLLNNDATSAAIHSLVTDELTELGSEDSLVLFYAGHGGNRRHLVGQHEVTTGYLIPFDGGDRVATWVDLEAWLRAVARLPAKHILVILDACHSGIALDPACRWRGSPRSGEPLPALSARRSRRIVTSALGDQSAMDGGPYLGHSLFTGCLIEALTHGLHADHDMVVTGSELGVHLQRRVANYPLSQQTPDFGRFMFDDCGEMVLSLALGPPKSQQAIMPETLPKQRRNQPHEREGHLGGKTELETAGVGARLIEHDDRSLFWDGVEQALEPPTTIRGARTRRFQSNRHGAFAANVRLGVVANANGAVRVHLWSIHRDRQHALKAIEHDVAIGATSGLPQLGPLKTRPAPNGEMLYLEFSWQRSGLYLPELERIKTCIQWFVNVARNRLD